MVVVFSARETFPRSKKIARHVSSLSLVFLWFIAAVNRSAAAGSPCTCLDVVRDLPDWNLFIYNGGLTTSFVDSLGTVSICGDMDVINYGVGEGLCHDADDDCICPGDGVCDYVGLRVCGTINGENFIVHHGATEYVSLSDTDESLFQDGARQITEETCYSACDNDHDDIIALSDRLKYTVENDACNTPPIVNGLMMIEPSTVPQHPSGYTLWCIKVR